jgi:hypothetical protein
MIGDPRTHLAEFAFGPLNRRAVVLASAMALGGCGFEAIEREQVAGGDTSSQAAAECEGDRACPACLETRHCAEEPIEEWIDGTCCAHGDPIEALGSEISAEAVDVVTDGRYAILCGGFGARIHDVSDPSQPTALAAAGERCQRAAFGGVRDGARVFYLAHHGDSWVAQPSLRTFRLDEGYTEEVQGMAHVGLPFEGLAWRDELLIAAVHQEGLRFYDTSGAGGVPHELTSLAGFENATKLRFDGDRLLVADGAGGLVVVDISIPAEPRIVSRLVLPGIARDVEVDDEGRWAYVALGASGIARVDLSTVEEPRLDRHELVMGSAQDLALADGRLAVASWDHVAVRDAATLKLLAAEPVRPANQFEQDFGIALHPDEPTIMMVAEWEGLHVLDYHEGRVAPDVWVKQDLVGFEAGTASDRVVVVRNRGAVTLHASEVFASSEAFTVDVESFEVDPGMATAIEVAYEPIEEPLGQSELWIESDDPDEVQSPFRLPLSVMENQSNIAVGDDLTQEFAFLDPEGKEELSGLEGKVVVLAYFALF